MNCEIANSKLSTFLDGELDSSEQIEVQKHISDCELCRTELGCFERLGECLRNAESPVDIDSMWSSIESRLHVERPLSSPRFFSRQAGFAIAASMLFIIGGITWIRQAGMLKSGNAGQHHASMAVDFQPVIEFASSDPVKAIQGLVEKYRGKKLSPSETEKYLGYQPATLKSVPSGFELVSTHVLDMPCCKCSATICQRVDGSSLIVFEHKDDQPLWFGENSGQVEQCAGVQCRIVDSVGDLAVSWKQGQRQFTLIGASDRSEIERWIETLKS